MRDANFKKNKFSLVKKWLKNKFKTEDFQAGDLVSGGVDDEEWRDPFSVREACSLKKRNTSTEEPKNRVSDHTQRCKVEFDASQTTDIQNYRIFAATWNVAGKSPPDYLDLDNWLHTSPPADIYVLGFQEIVPLNAGNVLGTEDNGPARKWLALIRRTLNSMPGHCDSCHTPSPVPDPIFEVEDDFEDLDQYKVPSFFHRRSFHSLRRSLRIMEDDISTQQPRVERRFSVCGRTRTSDYFDPSGRWDGFWDAENQLNNSPYTYHSSSSCTSTMDHKDISFGQSRFCLVACKQMVGIFLTIWIRSDLRHAVKNLKVSCVGRGLMGYLGNKGSISISMSLHQTSFCFVCSHLTSGEKDGDELRRNSDVMEILRKTRFPRVHGDGEGNTPRTILDHDRIIWLGDLNYRISLSYRFVKALVEMQNWRALLENDQLRVEQKNRRVFAGWNEGKIHFPPTYKYSNNSDRYAGENVHPKEKRRTPAWCDRILWHGHGLQQLSYVRGESRFSDHRPVCGTFLAQVESNGNKFKKNMSYSSSRIEVEELLPFRYGYHLRNFV